MAIGAGDRLRLERLCRYAARPPLAVDRLEKLADGRLAYRFRHPWRDGTSHVVLEPQELVAKLAALVPAPRTNLVRYQGVFAPGSKWRFRIVPAAVCLLPPPQPQEPATAVAPEAKSGGPEQTPPPPAESGRHPRNYFWAELMKRVFATDVLQCERCGGRMRILSPIHPPETTRKILDCLDLPSRAPPLRQAVLDSGSDLDLF